MTLRQMRYAVEAARLGSLSNASRTLFVSQSSLSFAIKELEREIGFEVFERSRQGIRPTPDGEGFLEKAREALRAVDAVESTYLGAKPRTHRLRIATEHSSIVAYGVSKLVSEMEAAGNPAHIKCRTCETGDVVEALAAGECDVGFIYATQQQERSWLPVFEAKGLDMVKLCRLELFIIINRNDPLVSRPALGPDDLAELTFVFGGDDWLDNFSSVAYLNTINFDFSQHYRYVDFNDSLVFIWLLSENRCFSVGHKSMVPRGINQLKYVSIRDNPSLELIMLRQKSRPEVYEIERLTAIVREAGRGLHEAETSLHGI